MLINYLLVTIRHLFKNKIFSLINVIGLSIAMAACLLIMLFVQYELSFEKMHPQNESIYRVLTIDKALGTGKQRVGITMPPMAMALQDRFPEVQRTLRMTGGRKMLLIHQNQEPVYAEHARYSDASFFDFFHFPLLLGNPQTALQDPATIVISSSLSQKIFGNANALGKQLRTGNGQSFTVTGIMEDLPSNTHFQFDALVSLTTIEAAARERQHPDSNRPIWLENWHMVAIPTYVQFVAPINTVEYDGKITALIREKGVEENFDITLQPLSRVHLHSKDIIFDHIAHKSDIHNVYIFSALAVLILLIATINYINLSMAKSAKRSYEVGIRKVMGSNIKQLMILFITESLLLALVALGFAVILIELTLPFLNRLTDAQMQFSLTDSSMLLGVVLFLMIGILGGFYPAWVLSKVSAVSMLQNIFYKGKQGLLLRKLLVIFQFSLSIALIILVITVQTQLHYIQNKDIGYDRHHVLAFEMLNMPMMEAGRLFADELTQSSTFSSVAITNNIPGRTFGRTGVIPEGTSQEEHWIWNRLVMAPEAMSVLGMHLVEGRNFDPGIAADLHSRTVLINETAAEQLDWNQPLGKRIFDDEDSTGVEVVGIVKDFHFMGLHEKIEPLIIAPIMPGEANRFIVARIQAGREDQALLHAQNQWKQFFPDYPFSYQFLDDVFIHLYDREFRSGKVIDIFGFLAIFISCLGLLGLISQAMRQRMREIGIRKVMGASVTDIVRLLSKELLSWILYANLIAWPLAFWACRKWLQDFAYQAGLHWSFFLLATAIALIVAWLTMSTYIIKMAYVDPAKTLKYE